MTTDKYDLLTEKLPYPSGRMIQEAYKMPLVLCRLGLGPVLGRWIMILTTTGRKSGLPRHTALEFHQDHGRKYVMVGWKAADWYKNIQAHPLVTLQTAAGTERARARQLTTPEELREAWEVAEKNPLLRGMMEWAGMDLTWESFFAHKDRFIILTFDPTDEATPLPLEADLSWLLFVGLLLMLAVLLLQRRLGTRYQKKVIF